MTVTPTHFSPTPFSLQNTPPAYHRAKVTDFEATGCLTHELSVPSHCFGILGQGNHSGHRAVGPSAKDLVQVPEPQDSLSCHFRPPLSSSGVSQVWGSWKEAPGRQWHFGLPQGLWAFANS